MYHVVQSLLSNSLVPALVEAAVPRIDDDGDMLDEPIDSEVLGEGAAEQSGEESADNDGEDGPRTPEPGTSGRDKSSQVASPQPESPPGEAPQENDNAIKSGPWTDDEIREMIRKRVEGWKHPRVAVSVTCDLSSHLRLRSVADHNYTNFRSTSGARSVQFNNSGVGQLPSLCGRPSRPSAARARMTRIRTTWAWHRQNMDPST